MIPSPGNFTTVKPVGRPREENPLVFKTVGLTAQQWAWLDLWLPGSSPTSQLRELFSRCLKFWPAGPAKFGHERKTATSSVTSNRIGTLDAKNTTTCSVAVGGDF